MKEEIKRIALFGGTFAPPHLGHVHALTALMKEIEFDRVIVMPTYIPPHKVKNNEDTPSQRLEMCKSAFGGLEKVEVSDYEITRGGRSYTIYTLLYLASLYEAEIYLLCGTDMFLTIDTWFRAEDIMKLATIVCMPRDNGSETLVSEKKEFLEKEYGAKVRIISSDAFEISSTEIRSMIKNGDDMTSLLPMGVIDIIRKENLYNGNGNDEQN